MEARAGYRECVDGTSGEVVNQCEAKLVAADDAQRAYRNAMSSGVRETGKTVSPEPRASQFRRQPDAAHVSIPVNDFGSDDALPPWIVTLKNFQFAGQQPFDGRVILFLVARVPVDSRLPDLVELNADINVAGQPVITTHAAAEKVDRHARCR